MKRENKQGDNVKKEYAMIFMELYPSQVQNKIKYHPKEDSILNDPLKIMDKISQSMHEHI